MYINRGSTFVLSEQQENGGCVMKALVDFNWNETKKLFWSQKHVGFDIVGIFSDWLVDKKFAEIVPAEFLYTE